NLAAAKASFDSQYGVGQWTLSSITLQLTAMQPNNAIFNGSGAGPSGTNVNFAGQFNLNWMTDDSWTEGNGTPAALSTTGGITWNTQPSITGDQSMGSPFSFGG